MKAVVGVQLAAALLGAVAAVVVVVVPVSAFSSPLTPPPNGASSTSKNGGGGGEATPATKEPSPTSNTLYSGQTTTRNIATQVLQGAGEALVDLNQYNLQDLQQIEQEWTANLVQKVGEKNARLRLGVQSDAAYFADSVTVAFPRLPDAPGLGIRLVELAGGREDGLGITLVTGLVSEGAAAGSDILPGDAIAKVMVVRQSKQQQQPGSADAVVTALSDTVETFSANTECLGYDATVEVLSGLPPPPPVDADIQEYFVLTLKRIRRKPQVTVNLQYPPSQNEPDVSIQLFAGENLRHGMLIRGVKLNDALAQRFDTKSGGNCGAGGLCRTCAVVVQQGADLLNPQRVAEQQMLADNPRWRLACKAIVGYGMKEGEMTIRVNPRQW